MDWDAGVQKLPGWVRWLLVLPTAIAAYVGVQLLVILGGLLSGSQLPDWAYQLMNSALSGYALVIAAAWMAPRGRMAVAVGMAVLSIGAGLLLIGVAISDSARQSDAWLGLGAAAVLGILGSLLACYQTWETQRLAIDANPIS